MQREKIRFVVIVAHKALREWIWRIELTSMHDVCYFLLRDTDETR